MPENPAPRGSFFQEIGFHIRLLFLLLLDRRIGFGTRLVFLVGLLYAINPYDYPSPLDDIFVLFLLSELFIALCPPKIVDEHLNRMRRTISGKWRDASDKEVIDVKFSPTSADEEKNDTEK